MDTVNICEEIKARRQVAGTSIRLIFIVFDIYAAVFFMMFATCFCILLMVVLTTLQSPVQSLGQQPLLKSCGSSFTLTTYNIFECFTVSSKKY